MSKITAYGLLIDFFILGLLLGIQIQTGIDASEEGLMIQVIKAINNTMPQSATATSLMNNTILTLELISILPIIVGIILLLAYGKLGIILGIIGAVSGVILVFNPTVGILLFIIGFFVSSFLDNQYN
jgi:hypothetical protein